MQQNTKLQENRLIVDETHKSWDDDSTGPKDENTEEAEVISFVSKRTF